MGIIKFILITLLIFYILRIILRLVFPMVLRSLFSKVQEQAGNRQEQRRAKPEGSISIDYMPPNAKTGKTDKLGDFVDYEELK